MVYKHGATAVDDYLRTIRKFRERSLKSYFLEKGYVLREPKEVASLIVHHTERGVVVHNQDDRESEDCSHEYSGKEIKEHNTRGRNRKGKKLVETTPPYSLDHLRV